MLNVQPLASEPKLVVSPGPATFVQSGRVDEIWDQQCIRRGGVLQDNEIFSVHELTAGQISGQFVSYRYLIAQDTVPELFNELGIRPLAVSGLLRFKDGIIFGRRAKGLTQDRGKWELVPSGGIEPPPPETASHIDLHQQILNELHEEIGLAETAIAETRAFCIVEDTRSHVIDIGIELVSTLSGKEILQTFEQSGSDEYESLELVSMNAIDDFVSRHDGNIVEVSLALLRVSGLGGLKR